MRGKLLVIMAALSALALLGVTAVLLAGVVTDTYRANGWAAAAWVVVGPGAAFCASWENGPIGRPVYRHVRETAMMFALMRLEMTRPSIAKTWADRAEAATTRDWVLASGSFVLLMGVSVAVATTSGALTTTLLPPLAAVAIVLALVVWMGHACGREAAAHLLRLS